LPLQEEPGRVGREMPCKRPKMKGTFTWNAQTKVFVIVEPDSVNVLKATAVVLVQQLVVQITAMKKVLALASPKWP